MSVMMFLVDRHSAGMMPKGMNGIVHSVLVSQSLLTDRLYMKFNQATLLLQQCTTTIKCR